MTLRAVFDRNVLVAAFSIRRGASFALPDQIIDTRFVLLASPALWLEYEAVIKRPEIRKMHLLTLEDVDDALNALCLHVVPVMAHFLWRPQRRNGAGSRNQRHGNASCHVQLGRFRCSCATPPKSTGQTGYTGHNGQEAGPTRLHPLGFFETFGEINTSQVALRLPDSLHQYAKQLAAEDNASLNQFIVTAVGEKYQRCERKLSFRSGQRCPARPNSNACWIKCETCLPAPVTS